MSDNAEPKAAPKNIVLLSDGTGNSSAKLFKTNVWRLFQTLDLADPARQIAYYDDGVGTSSFKLFAVLGGVFGFGLKRNVIDIYSFCCRNYKSGDRIYCFGFSRGAFTIRIVAGMIAYQGLVAYDNNEADLARFAADAYRLYRRRFNGGILKYLGYAHIDLRGMRDRVISWWRRFRGQKVSAPSITEIESIHFVGIWDTVDAYGGPIQEMTRAIDYWIWPLSMPDHFMSAKVHRACHALALEEERDAFSPVIWDERYVRGTARVAGQEKTQWLFGIDYDPRCDAAKAADPAPHARTDVLPIDRERISQVWFTGVHSDIGGGYPQNGLSFVTLDWMMDRAKAYGLHYLDAQRELLLSPQIDPNDKLNNSRKGLASYYRYKPRNLADIYKEPPYKLSIRADARTIWRLLRKQADPQAEILEDLHPDMSRQVLPVPKPTIHDSVFERIEQGTDRYAPVVIPAPDRYKFTDSAGAVFEGPHRVDPPGRSSVQDDVWNWIWLRRVVYFLTVFCTLFVASIPFFVIYAPGFGRGSVGGFVEPDRQRRRIISSRSPRSLVCRLSQRTGLCADRRGRNRRVAAVWRESSTDRSRRRARRLACAGQSHQAGGLAGRRVSAAQVWHLSGDVLCPDALDSSHGHHVVAVLVAGIRSGQHTRPDLQGNRWRRSGKRGHRRFRHGYRDGLQRDRPESDAGRDLSDQADDPETLEGR